MDLPFQLARTFTSSKINILHSIQESNLHVYYYTARKVREEKGSLGWEEVGGYLQPEHAIYNQTMQYRLEMFASWLGHWHRGETKESAGVVAGI